MISQYKEKSFVVYSTAHLIKKDKIRFYYALKGRDGISGMVKELNCIHLGKTALMIDEDKTNELIAFLDYWKCSFVVKKIYVYTKVS